MSSPVLSPEAFEAIQPRDYQTKFFDNGMRSDGRGFHETRPTSIISSPIHSANGSALVRLGETVVIAGVKAEVAEPALSSPNLGYLVINVELPSFSDPNLGSSPTGPSAEALELTRTLHQLYQKCDFLPFDSLCICPGQAVWTLHVDIICLNHDGNLFDAAVLACSAALKDVKLPTVMYDMEHASVTATSLPQIPLQLSSEEPFPFSLLLLDDERDDGVAELVDPLKKELLLQGSLVNIVLGSTSEDRLLYFSKRKGNALSQERLLKCIQLAQNQRNLSTTLLSCPE